MSEQPWKIVAVIALVLALEAAASDLKEKKDPPNVLHPYVVSLTDRGEHICGGALVRRRCVVTAASCLYENWDKDVLRNAKKLHVHAASNTLLWEDGVFVAVHQIQAHKEYNLGIVLLRFALRPQENVLHTIKIADNFPKLHEIATLYSWNSKAKGKTLVDTEVTIRRKEECLYKDKSWPDFTFCGTSSPLTEREIGSPLVKNNSLIGILVQNTEHPNHKSVIAFANVVNASEWLKSNMKLMDWLNGLTIKFN